MYKDIKTRKWLLIIKQYYLLSNFLNYTTSAAIFNTTFIAKISISWKLIDSLLVFVCLFEFLCLYLFVCQCFCYFTGRQSESLHYKNEIVQLTDEHKSRSVTFTFSCAFSSLQHSELTPHKSWVQDQSLLLYSHLGFNPSLPKGGGYHPPLRIIFRPTKMLNFTIK